MAVAYYIKIFLSIFNTKIKKTSNNKFSKNIVLILLVWYIIIIYLLVKNIIFDCFLQFFVVELALKIYK